MKKLFKLFVVLVVLVVIAVAGAFYYVDAIAEKAIERGGEMALGVPTQLDEVNISLWGGEASLSGLQIANPHGFSEATFMGLGRGDAAVSIGSLMSDTVRLPRIRLSNIRINLEQRGKKNNIQPLLARAKSMSGGSGGGSGAGTAQQGGGKKFIVEYFSLEDVQVKAALDVVGQTSSVNLVLPKIELRNLGAKEQGLPMPELIQKVVQAVLSAVENSSGRFSPALARLLQGELSDLDTLSTEVVGQARAQVEKAVSELKDKVDVEGTLDQVKEKVAVPEDTEKAVKEKTDELMKGVGDLLGGGKKE